MIIKKTVLVTVCVLFGHIFSIKAAEDSGAGDKELLAKLLTVVFKCFKDADWSACGEMLTSKYDITQPKYKKCTCSMACTGEDLGLINDKGESVPSKFLEYVNLVNNTTIKSQMQIIYDKCQDVKGTEKCDLSEKFAQCVFKESPMLKERMVMLIDTIMKMKPK